MTRVAIVGPVFPYRAGIAYCTTRLAQELGADVVSFKRQYPKRWYPGGDDVDPTLPRARADFILDVLNPLTWLRAALRLRAYDAVVFVWWIWVWALPYRLIMALLPRRTRVILQCHNIGDKEPAAWKRALSNLVLRRGDALVVHARSEASDAARRAPGRKIVQTFLPVHELGGAMPPRDEAKKKLGVEGRDVALFFGHVRPFKGLDLAMRAWAELTTNPVLFVAGELWWQTPAELGRMATELGIGHRSGASVAFELRFIPDAEIATYFAAADVVLAPYRVEAQSGVALTAFHFGRPVIASDAGGLPEVVDGSNGIVVPSEDVSALARAVDEFFTTRDRAAMEAAAVASARRYSWKKYAAVFADLVAPPNAEFRIQNSE
jgi:glycosyltransferase involved in cell wall biosynthesis